jgi:hypothetical protein
MQQMSHDPVNLALLNLGINPGKLKRNIRNVDLTDDQYDEFQMVAGRSTKARLDVIVNSRDWQAWPNHVRKNVIVAVIDHSREAARNYMMMRYPQIMRDATQAKIDRLTED